MKKILLSLLLLIFLSQHAGAMCGCMFGPPQPQVSTQSQMVAGIHNKSSQVIMVRDGNKTSITMTNDVYGDLKDFAMVIPVPMVLKRDQISTVDPYIFTLLDQVSGPKLTSIWDVSPCNQAVLFDDFATESISLSKSNAPNPGTKPQSTQSTVKVEAQYAVGEYDILILSAQESDGLMVWLKEHGYFVSEKASEVLEPYVKSEMKFFVVKVNLERKAQTAGQFLTPLKISFESQRFMLPIRLGMANADGDQDLTVYAFTRTGRVEPTNYRLAEMPTNTSVPAFVANDFNHFYADMFTTSWKREGRNAVMLEYAGIPTGVYFNEFGNPLPSPNIYLEQIGIDWQLNPEASNPRSGPATFLTRMHLRYNRSTFPQDLAFQITPNNTPFQCNLTVQYVSPDWENCEEGKIYANQVIKRRWREVVNMNNLAGWSINDHYNYPTEHLKDKPAVKKGELPIELPTPSVPKPIRIGWFWLAGFGMILIAVSIRFFLISKV